MFKLIKNWFNEYNEYQKAMRDMGYFYHCHGWGVYSHFDRETYEAWLSKMHDRHKTIQRTTKHIKE